MLVYLNRQKRHKSVYYYKMKYKICSDKIHQGGAVAAPVGGQILGDVLPYLELTKDNQETTEQIEEVEVPEIREMNLKDAKKVLKELGLEIKTNVEITKEMKEEEIIIKEQSPKPGIKVNKGSKISVEV